LNEKRKILRSKNLSTAAILALTASLVLPITAAFAATLSGTSGNNVIKGTSYRDTIYGYGGDDIIYGYGSSDKIYGGRGNDVVYGGRGNDYIQDLSGYDTDYLYGGPGADEIRCKGYQCHVYGEGGNDRIYIEPQDNENTARGGAGNDYIEGIGHGMLYGNDGDDTLKGGLDQYGGAGADHFICDPDGNITSVLDYHPEEGDVIENPDACAEILSL
jgi:Ca2+-binding RTX toxin-like protein